MGKYKISVIVPVYNVSNYLDDCVLSLVNQKYDFSKVEVILVNDGSTDNSLEICNKYANKYENIKVIDKKNGGLSDARNHGFKASNGEYIMFLDSDDLINDKSLLYLSKFLDEHKEVDFVISRVRMFEKTNKWHYLDYRFKSDKTIVDIMKDINYVQYHSTGILIRKKAIKDIEFSKKVKIGEDMHFMSRLLFKNNLFGIEKRSVLFYRKRYSNDSIVQKQMNNKYYYVDILKDIYKFILDEAKKIYGEVPQYFQYYVLNSLVERFDMEYPKGLLSKEEFDEYIKLLTNILKSIDDEVILKQRRIGFNIKYYLLNFKRNGNKLKVGYKDNRIYVDDKPYKFKVSEFIRILNIEKKDGGIKVYFVLNDYLFKNRINPYINGEKVRYKEVEYPDYEKKVYRDILFRSIYEEKVCMIEYSYKRIKTLCFQIGNEKIPYSISESFLPTYDSEIRYKRFGLMMVVFKYRRNIILFNKTLNITRDIWYKYKNYRFNAKVDNYKKVLINKGKIKKIKKM